MSFAPHVLHRLLSTKATRFGTVVSKDKDKALIATEIGAVWAAVPDDVSPGERVIVQHSVAYRAPKAQTVLRV